MFCLTEKKIKKKTGGNKIQTIFEKRTPKRFQKNMADSQPKKCTFFLLQSTSGIHLPERLG